VVWVVEKGTHICVVECQEHQGRVSGITRHM
jgi:hypothetical protein